MAEGMADVAQDDFVRPDHDATCFDADQLNDLAQTIWGKLEQLPDGSCTVLIPNHQAEFAKSVRENCEDNTDGRTYSPDMDEDDQDQCYVGECKIGES